MTANEQELLQVGYFITVSPQLRLGFVDEVKNFCLALFVEPELQLIVAVSGWLNAAPLAAILMLAADVFPYVRI